jgi:hypothetical protein
VNQRSRFRMATLSKAFLLADDRRIEDPSIRRQIAPG